MWSEFLAMKFVLLLLITCSLAECSLFDPRFDVISYAFSNSSNGHLLGHASRKLHNLVDFPKIRARELFARQETCNDPADGRDSVAPHVFLT